MTTWVKRLWVELKTDGLRNTISAQTFHSEEKGGEKKKSQNLKNHPNWTAGQLTIKQPWYDVSGADVCMKGLSSIGANMLALSVPSGNQTIRAINFCPRRNSAASIGGETVEERKSWSVFFSEKITFDTFDSTHYQRRRTPMCLTFEETCLPAFLRNTEGEDQWES